MADYSFFDEDFDSFISSGGGGIDLGEALNFGDVLGSFNLSDIDLGIGDSYGGGFDLDLSSLGDSFGFDLSNIDLGNLGLGSLDLGGLNFDMGGLDLGSLVGKDSTTLDDILKIAGGRIDTGDIYQIPASDITFGPDITGGDVALVDLLQSPSYDYIDSSTVVPDYDYIDSSTLVPEYDYIDSSTVVPEYDYIDSSTLVPEYDYIDSSTVVPDERIYDAEAQEGGFYGNTPNATYDPRTNTTTIRNPDGSTRTIQGPPITTSGGGGSGGGGTGGGKASTVQDQSNLLKSLTSKDNALLMALLGGLLGLLSKGTAPKGPVGYQGGIPRYTATRGQAMAPTAGGRRPGGAGIPSLTGGVTYQRAAQGGLMGMAEGGRAARYLRGNTDGMADKIQTDIDGKQPARLSHGEFVIPSDIVSHLGNGNSDAGADVLYDMMDKIRKARTGTTKQGKQINPRKYIPA